MDMDVEIMCYSKKAVRSNDRPVSDDDGDDILGYTYNCKLLSKFNPSGLILRPK
jgi:hypothetical protein